MYVSSRDKGATKNNGADFSVQLSEPIKLDGEWSCALTEYIHHTVPTGSPPYVCCDLLHVSHGGRHRLPILRRIHHKSTQFIDPAYVPLKVNEFDSIRIYAVTLGNKATLASGKTHSYCTLHFRQRA